MTKPLDSEWLRRKYEAEGLTIREVAREARSTTECVMSRMREAGIAPRSRGERVRLWPRNAEIVRLREEGQSYRQIAAKIGISASRVVGIVARSGRTNGYRLRDPE